MVPPLVEAVARGRPERGVYLEEIAPTGEHWYKVVLSSGKIGTIRVPDELVDSSFEENLWRQLDAGDAVRVLRLV
jgi:hypothetical protein